MKSKSIVVSVFLAAFIAFPVGAYADPGVSESKDPGISSNRAAAVETQKQNPDAGGVKEKETADQPAIAKETQTVDSSASVASGATVCAVNRAGQDGWVSENGYRYYYRNGQRLVGSQAIDARWYRFSFDDGHMLTGSQSVDNKWYRYDLDQGYMLTGSQYINNAWYRYDLDQGYMLTGSQCIDGKWYYYDPYQGYMHRGSSYIAGNWYRYDPDQGYMLTGSQSVDNKWYRYDLDQGYMLTGSQYIGDKWYRYDPDQGYMLTGSQSVDGKWYRYDLDQGYMLTGSQYINNAWYRYDPDQGYMLTGSQCIDGKWYYYDPYQGYMHRGSSFVNGNWYRYDPDSGCMMTGLVGVDGRFYWYDVWGGQMLYGWLNLFGCPCHFNTEQGYLDEGDPAWLVPYSLNDAVIAQVNKGVRGYTYNDYAQYMDPAEIFKKNINSLQFMRLDGGYSGVTAEQLNAYIANNCTTQEWNTGRRSTLRNIGSNIVQVSKETGVNEVYILAHAIWESQWGCSKLAAGKVAGYEGYYNFYGIGAYDFDPLNGGAALAKQENWTTPALAIQGGAKWITKNYLRQSYVVGNETVFQNTLYNMRFAPGLRNVWHQYATGINWAQGISTLMLEVYNGTGVPLRVPYEVPVYS